MWRRGILPSPLIPLPQERDLKMAAGFDATGVLPLSPKSPYPVDRARGLFVSLGGGWAMGRMGILPSPLIPLPQERDLKRRRGEVGGVLPLSPKSPCPVYRVRGLS
jgi:hypothetical protein